MSPKLSLDQFHDGAAVERMRQIERRITALIEKREDDLIPDAAKAVLALMLLEPSDDDPSRTNLEVLCQIMLDKAMGKKVEGSLKAIEQIFDRTYGRTGDNDSMLKGVKRLFAGLSVEYMAPPAVAPRIEQATIELLPPETTTNEPPTRS